MTTKIIPGNITNTGVTAGSYTSANITVNAQGQVTSASNGSSGSPGGSNTQVQYNNSGTFGGISGFTTDGTRVTASTTIGVGGATPSTSGSGITFPATQSASTDANTLDDYEEGTWSPTCSNGSTFTGNYIKIGKMVHLFYSTSSSGTITANSTTLTGLPFTVDSSSGCGVYANVTSTANFGGTQASSPTTLYFLTSSSSAALRGYHPYYVA